MTEGERRAQLVMYVHEVSGSGTDFYPFDPADRWQPDIVEQWIARITPAANLRDTGSHDHAAQQRQRDLDGMPIDEHVSGLIDTISRRQLVGRTGRSRFTHE